MKKTLQRVYLLVSSVLITLVHIPAAFAKPLAARPGPRSFLSGIHGPGDSLQFVPNFKSVYDSLHLDVSGLSRQAFDYARKGWEKLLHQGRILNESVIAIIDFSQPSDHKRLFVLDMKNYKVLFQTLVAHGKNSGKEWAHYFSNQPSSYKSSPGFYVTGDTYSGSNGYSLKLQGVERGINDKAYKRAIVLHGADYVDESYIASQGYIGRSEGCPAVPIEEAGGIIDAIKDGSCLFIYTPDRHYLSRSALLR